MIGDLLVCYFDLIIQIMQESPLLLDLMEFLPFAKLKMPNHHFRNNLNDWVKHQHQIMLLQYQDFLIKFYQDVN